MDTYGMVDAARRGDRRAQDDLVAAYLPLVYNIVGRALNGHADVDDVVQETMLRAVDGLPRLRDPAAFRSWLVAIAMNQIRGRWQEQQARNAYHGTADAYGHPADAAGHDPFDVADPRLDFVEMTIVRLGLSGQRREVAEATRWLDPDDRDLLALWWLEAAGEITRRELAMALHLPPEHAAVRVQRMKGQLELSRVVVRALAAEAAGPRCRDLRGLASRWDGRPASVWRKRFARHVRECGRCSGYGGDLVPAERLLVALGMVPLAVGLAGLVAAALRHGATLAATGAAWGGPISPTFSPSFGEAISGFDGPPAPGSAPAPQPQPQPAQAPHVPRAARHSHRAAAPRGLSRISAHPIITGAAGVTAVAIAGLYFSTSSHPAPVTDARGTDGLEVSNPAAVSTAPASTSAAAAAPAATTAVPSSTHARTTPSTTPSTSRSPAPAAPPPATDASAVQQVLALINKARADQGLPPLTITDGLTRSATAHNQVMASGCGMMHQCPGEAGLGDRETAAGVQWSSAGENIGEGGPVANTTQGIAGMALALTQDMLNEKPPNDGHRRNILSTSFTHIGIAVYRDSKGTVWMTQDFSN